MFGAIAPPIRGAARAHFIEGTSNQNRELLILGGGIDGALVELNSLGAPEITICTQTGSNKASFHFQNVEGALSPYWW